MTLSVKRKADRRKMADAVAALFERSSAPVTVSIIPEGEDYGERRRTVSVKYENGIRCGIDFDGDCGNGDGAFVLAWNLIGAPEGAKFTEDFGWAAGGEVNPFHRRKCTTVAYGWDHLLRQLDAVIDVCNSGKALSNAGLKNAA